jgi:hypothetical protein
MLTGNFALHVQVFAIGFAIRSLVSIAGTCANGVVAGWSFPTPANWLTVWSTGLAPGRPIPDKTIRIPSLTR